MSSTVDSYARALVDIADAEGNLAVVENELYRIARAFEANDQLRSTLNDETLPIERRQGVVEQLLSGKASNTTTQIVSFIVGNGRGRDLPAIIDAIVHRASSADNKEVAIVRTAVALSDDQQRRLADALVKKTGRQINLKVIVDPSVLGGVVATVGDTVIDGSVRSRLDQLKSRL
jgi:F-type H+-transporting ATPase subunit delta